MVDPAKVEGIIGNLRRYTGTFTIWPATTKASSWPIPSRSVQPSITCRSRSNPALTWPITSSPRKGSGLHVITGTPLQNL